MLAEEFIVEILLDNLCSNILRLLPKSRKEIHSLLN